MVIVLPASGHLGERAADERLVGSPKEYAVRDQAKTGIFSSVLRDHDAWLSPGKIVIEANLDPREPRSKNHLLAVSEEIPASQTSAGHLELGLGQRPEVFWPSRHLGDHHL